ncbi:MAG: sodium:solute symporter [Planctomycetaceae bacterium]|nr:sodium:solute symporter [Planctomycetaceae bacterium]
MGILKRVVEMLNLNLCLFANTVGLGIYDWATLVIYFLVLIGVAMWVIRQRTDTSQDYFLAGKKAGWVLIGASLFASNIGSEHLVGLAGTGASDGMAMAHYELHAWCLLTLGWVMVPFYERSGVYTVPEFLEKRYSAVARWFLSIVSLIAYIMTKVSIALFAGGTVFGAIFPVDVIPGISNFWVGAVGMVLLTGIYTLIGGLRAVLYTELIQTAVLLLGSAAVFFIGLQQIGGWDELKKTVHGTDKIIAHKVTDPENRRQLVDLNGNLIFVKRPKLISDGEGGGKKIDSIDYQYLRQEEVKLLKLEDKFDKYWKDNPEEFKNYIAKTKLPVNAKIQKTDHFNLWKPNSDPVFPWFGLLFGAPIVGLWYWCSDQYIVQRTLAARNQCEARRGTIFGAYLKLAPVFLFIVPGMIAYGLAVKGEIGAEVLYNPNEAFPVLVKEVLPMGLRGLVVGALMAALMSSLASVFNSCSTLFTMDIYKKIRPEASELQLVWTGRLATAVIVVLSLIWIPVINMMPSLYGYLQSVQSYVAPPIAAVFFLGVFIKRVNVYGCMTGLIGGFLLGMLRLVLEIIHAVYKFESGTILHYFATTSFTFIAIYLTLFCALLIIGVSLLTPKPDYEKLTGLTYTTATEAQKRETRESWNKLDVILTVGLFVSILSIYIYFTG